MSKIYTFSTQEITQLYESVDCAERCLVDAVCDDNVEALSVRKAIGVIQNIRSQLNCGRIECVDEEVCNCAEQELAPA